MTHLTRRHFFSLSFAALTSALIVHVMLLHSVGAHAAPALPPTARSPVGTRTTDAPREPVSLLAGRAVAYGLPLDVTIDYLGGRVYGSGYSGVKL
jgi:hypothetical protein